MTNPFVGSWRLISAIYERDGRAAFPFGRHPVGLLIYDDLGNMSVQIMHPHYADSAHTPDTAGQRAAFAGYLAYFGACEISETETMVRHYVQGSTLRHWVGSVQERTYEFSGNRLTLSAPATTDQAGAQAVLIWERIEPEKQ